MSRFARASLVALAATLLFTATSEHAGAKVPAWVITGGALGDHAAFFFEDWETSVSIPGEGATRIEAPAGDLGEPYDLYTSSGPWLAHEVREFGPAARYYPAAGLLEYRWRWDTDRAGWYRPPPETIRLLNETIAEAVTARRSGELEVGVVAADLEHRGYGEVSYYIRPLEAGSITEAEDVAVEGGNWRFDLGPPPGTSVISPPHSAPFALDALVKLLNEAPAHVVDSADELPAYAIWHYGTSGAGMTWGGFFAYYSPPSAGAPGRLWPYGLSRPEVEGASTPVWYETTPALGAYLEHAIAGTLDQLPASRAEPALMPAQRGEAVPWALAAALVAAVGTVVAATGSRPRATD